MKMRLKLMYKKRGDYMMVWCINVSGSKKKGIEVLNEGKK